MLWRCHEGVTKVLQKVLWCFFSLERRASDWFQGYSISIVELVRSDVGQEILMVHRAGSPVSMWSPPCQLFGNCWNVSAVTVARSSVRHGAGITILGAHCLIGAKEGTGVILNFKIWWNLNWKPLWRSLKTRLWPVALHVKQFLDWHGRKHPETISGAFF